MRRKKEAVLSFESSDDGLPKVVRDYRARYRAISQVFDNNPEILSAGPQGPPETFGRRFHRARRRLHFGEHPAGIDRAAPRRTSLPRRRHPHRQRTLPARLPADAEETGDGLHLPGQVLPGHPAEDLEAGQRTAWPVRGCAEGGQHQRHPHRHDRRGIQHPLPHRCVALVGHLAGGVAAVGPGKRDQPGKCAAPLP